MSLPATSANRPVEDSAAVLRLKRGEERRLLAGHLWVFSNEVDTDRTPLGQFIPGAVAELRSYRDAFLAHAYVNPHALICARILSREAAQRVGAELIERRLTGALALRASLGDARYCRWVFGESDLLPGLVLDRYGDIVVGQIATAGMEALRESIEHQPRQQVRLAEHPAAVTRVAEALTERQRGPEAPLDELTAHRLRRIPRQDARADQRVRIDVGVSEERVAVRAQLDHRARRELPKRRALRVDFVTEYPQVPGGETPLLAALQAQHARVGIDRVRWGRCRARHEIRGRKSRMRVYRIDANGPDARA